MPEPALAAAAFVCPCGAPASADLPAPGRYPAGCERCGTPLVRPGPVPSADVRRGAGAGLVVALAAALAWSELALRTAAGVPWLIPVAALAIAVAMRVAARARSPGLQWSAVGLCAAFLGAGEVLLYRRALEVRLVAMHAAEHVAEPELPAQEELREMTFLSYLGFETGLAWFVAVALGVAVAWLVLRAPPAVAAFPGRAPRDAAPDTLPAAPPRATPDAPPDAAPAA